jgi:AraC family transcriptional regulator, regulatory protein of adaptative response / methylated-DNA-[protein]-cysteine methyltransferase
MRTQLRDDAAARWLAVLQKDATSDGAFVYAVRSTGVYCRPSCPSRRPRRENVVFFTGADEAERAGFRACRRCQPDGQRARSAAVEQACRYLEAHLDTTVTLAGLAEAVGYSPEHLQRTFKQVLGVSPRQYADARRLERFKTHLREGRPVTHAMYDAGYGASSRLYEKSPQQLGMTPRDYRRGGRGRCIHFAFADCPLGRLLVAATERGLCHVALGDSDMELRAGLEAEFAEAELRADTSGLAEWMEAILRHLDGREPRLDLPLDVRATAFQRRVWEELRRIPYGITRSYRETAETLGMPGGARAVARACATNPVALVVPCHRVIRDDGDLGGYRWGLSRKRNLLAKESAVTAG